MTRARELAKLANSNVFSVDANNNVGVNSSTPDAKLDVVGVISATSFSGDGSNLTGIVAGATLNASSGTQRLVVTSQTSGSMTQAATNSNITYNTSTSTLSATQYSGNLSGNATGLQGTPSITVQDITAEQISAAGTVTYARVENVNSVGIITANKGIKVPNYGVVVTGVVTATSFQGDGSGLTGVESGTQSFVASGTIPNGATVVIKTDGTVGIVTQTGSANPSVGTPVTVNTLNSSPSSAYDASSGKVVIVWSDWNGSAYGAKAIVGTVDPSNNSISFGSAVTFNNAMITYQSVTYDSANGKVVVCYCDGNQYIGRAKVGTVSGTSISFGSAGTFNSGQSTRLSSVSTTNGKVVVAYTGTSDHGTAVVGTVSGTSISFGSVIVFNNRLTYKFACAYDSTNDKAVVFYQDQSNSSSGRAKVGTVSGTSINFGSEEIFSSTSTDWMAATYDSANKKVVVAYENSSGGAGSGKAIVGTVSGTSISFGTEAVFNNTTTNTGITYDSAKEKIIIAYGGGAIVGTVSGTSISFGTAVQYYSGGTYMNSPVYDSANGRVSIAYKATSSDHLFVVVLTTNSIETNLTSENYIGIAAETIANTATGKITVVGGTNTGQTGLTTAQTYYVQTNGTLATSAGNPSVVAGTSVSSTKIAVQKS
jgi:hypothetical protein